MKICKITHCEREVYQIGYCRPHYRSEKKYGDPLYVEKKRIAPKPRCRLEGCENVATSRKLCEKHYTRLRRTGQLDITKIEKGSITTCLLPECNRPHNSQGYCKTHYENYRLVDAPTLPRIVRYCGIPNCNNPHSGRGMCTTHYGIWEANLHKHGLSHQITKKDNEE